MHLWKNWYHEKRRATYALKRYRSYFGDSVVDIGSGASPEVFRKELGVKFKSVDANSVRCQHDYYVDLEAAQLPFKDGEFETVLCFDNLEHLENCHEMVDELIRISKKYVIISLPNNWPGILSSIFRGRNVSHRFGYGLPPEKPRPGVRHKWFFNLEEASLFLTTAASRNKAQVRELNYVYERGGFNLLSIPPFYPQLFRLSSVLVDRFYDLDEEDQKKFGKKGIQVQKILQVLGRPLSLFLMYGVKALSLPFWLVDEILKHLIWGWGSRFRYLNMFCRQIWIVIEKPAR